MTVDIVIVTFRSAEVIAECLASVPIEVRDDVVLVENASGDAAPSIARSFGVQVVENTENRGFGAAANQGAAAGSNDIILFLNPDARLAPGTIATMSAAFTDPAVAVAGVHLVYPDGRAQKSRWPYPTAAAMWAESFGLHRLRPHTSGGFVVGACFAVRRTMFELLGGFDERYWLYGEEADLCARAEACGWKVVLTDAEVEHEGGASGREMGDLVFEHFSRGSERFVLIHEGRGALVSYRVAALLGAAIRWPLLRLRRPGDPRTATRARQVRRLIRVLFTSPATVADEPVAAGPRLTVLSLEAWDEVWRRNQFLVRELLAQHPGLRVLWMTRSTS
jgi:N-acetylglucosaminyl-diphospho-decaprenol L-rhamnosyltransferase